MLNTMGMALALVIVPAQTGGGEAQLFSGPQPGEKLTAFKVLAVTGPSAGQQIEILATPKETPRVLVFVHELTRPATQLFRPLDVYASKLAPEGLETHFIWLTSDKTKTEQYLNGVKQTLGLKATIVMSLDGIEGPGNYGLNRKCALTVLVAKGEKVVANFAIVQPNETDAPKVVAAVAKMMGKKPPTDEELGIQRQAKQTDKAKKAISQELQALMRKMIQKTNDAAEVQTIAGQMLAWAGDDRQKQAELRNYCLTILDLGYGTEACKKALTKLAGK